MNISRSLKYLALTSALLVVSGMANATLITRNYDSQNETSGGIVTFDDGTANKLKITIDNTTTGLLSSAITGVVFDIDADILGATIESFEDGTGAAIPNWTVEFGVNGSITPGNTTVDIYFARGSINDGIYNAANTDTPNDNGLVPDIAVLILSITNPASDWSLNGTDAISNDILRMQRTGLDGKGSLKLPGYPPGGEPDPDLPVPVPGTLLLLGLGLFGLRFARKSAV